MIQICHTVVYILNNPLFKGLFYILVLRTFFDMQVYILHIYLTKYSIMIQCSVDKLKNYLLTLQDSGGKRVKEKNQKLIFSFLTAIIALIPTLFLIAAYLLLSPEGFWQNFILLGAGVYVLGSVQFFLAIVWAVVLIFTWKS